MRRTAPRSDPRPSRAWRVVRGALVEALALVLPVTCAGCAEPDVALCESCRAALEPSVERRRLDACPVWSGLLFEAVVARVVRGLKEDGRTGLARSLAPALAAAVRAASDAAGGAPVTLVPVPTSRASFRRRGFHVAELVARRAGLRVERMLRPTRQVSDQRGLDVAARRRNVAGSLAVRSLAAGRASARVLVLDDVLTTGATVAEAVRALRAGGAEVLGAVTIAATPRRTGIVRGNRA